MSVPEECTREGNSPGSMGVLIIKVMRDLSSRELDLVSGLFGTQIDTEASCSMVVHVQAVREVSEAAFAQARE